MKEIENYRGGKRIPFIKNRHDRTINFFKKYIPKGTDVLDLGVKNTLSDRLKQEGYKVTNTQGEDLDINYHKIHPSKVVSALNIFEHMFAPFNILQSLSGCELVASVPLSKWFSKAHWIESGYKRKHYHEFEIKQFNYLLKETGWKILESEVWCIPDTFSLGIRFFLRFITPAFYIIHAKKL